MSWVITGSEKTPVDPQFGSVSLLLHGNGTNGSTTITDNSPTPKTVIAVGNAQISTAQSKFGGASIAFDGNGDGINISGTHNALAMGTVDFTIEMFVYLNSLKSQSFYDTLALGSPATDGIRIRASDTGQVQIFRYAGVVIHSSVNLSTATWTHLALVKTGATLTLYISGTNRGSTADSANYTCGSNRPSIGVDGYVFDTGYLDGYIDELRVTKGVARYTANFTPPTAQFPDI